MNAYCTALRSLIMRTRARFLWYDNVMRVFRLDTTVFSTSDVRRDFFPPLPVIIRRVRGATANTIEFILLLYEYTVICHHSFFPHSLRRAVERVRAFNREFFVCDCNSITCRLRDGVQGSWRRLATFDRNDWTHSSRPAPPEPREAVGI